MVNSSGICVNLRQAIILITLFSLFFYFFGLESLKKWERNDVQVVTRRVPSKTLRLPAITLCAKGKGMFNVDEVIGWSLLTTSSKENLLNTTGEQLNKTLWTLSETKGSYGMCYTMA